MTPLRPKMIHERPLQRLAPKTPKASVTAVAGLAQFYDCSPDRLRPEHIRTSLPHLLVARRGKADVAWSVLVFRDSAWRCEKLYVRLRYRGLGLESDLGRLTRLVLRAR